MFDLFKKHTTEDNLPDWYPELIETQERFFTFLTKLEEKMEELCSAAIPELKELQQNDTDPYKRNFARMQAAVLGQLDTVNLKANTIQQEKILNYKYELERRTDELNKYRNLITEFNSKCSDRYCYQFKTTLQQWIDKVRETAVEDLEIKYQNVLKEYNDIKDKFTCKQCGGTITIEKIFYLNTFVTCSYCQTQNSFEPSTQAKMVLNFAQELAIQRSKNDSDLYNAAIEKERDLYLKRHQLKISSIANNDSKQKQQLLAEIQQINQERNHTIDSFEGLYIKFIDKKYKEWLKILPDNAEHLQQRKQNELNSFTINVTKD
jgi:hypothetical protein